MTKDIFQQQPVLENERVLLRPLQENDFDNLLLFSLNEPDIWKFGLVTAAGEANLRNYINTAVKNLHDKKEYPFIVFDKIANRYAGSTRFYDIQQPWLTTQLGYTWYGKDFQQTGLNRHCKLLLLTYVFEEWGLERLEFRADANNAKSIAAMKAIGCLEEGILRNHMPTAQGGRRDSIVLSILKKEWFEGVKENLLKKIH
ncbi:MAG: GNAT family N-acetyltransferase [Chitinophagaceae bacterium]|jgi:RimJ/RimL family protein N-acetyltransferase|nr:GNAT family N-acetyltransferase [Chitinophagaceae bacterium]MBK8300296.1 GNAT family N-acetyltransferase [Chitinophagaceae bacterium]MBL0066989.1 GNAT family N-acetyltransferase [Chitinophagaceae bacterium]MBP6232245.1 GNAT family N-acetyltransferase [Chitinophagaceae bacterium]MBP6415942.1 GNAT family N-acetyltransferase [Chitinophagaceae bacterium]